jgi:hypothetical protein
MSIGIAHVHAIEWAGCAVMYLIFRRYLLYSLDRDWLSYPRFRTVLRSSR